MLNSLMVVISPQHWQMDANKSIPAKPLETLCQITVSPGRLSSFSALLEGSLQHTSMCVSKVPQKYPYH